MKLLVSLNSKWPLSVFVPVILQQEDTSGDCTIRLTEQLEPLHTDITHFTAGTTRFVNIYIPLSLQRYGEREKTKNHGSLFSL